jgi:hypothetical protein
MPRIRDAFLRDPPRNLRASEFQLDLESPGTPVITPAHSLNQITMQAKATWAEKGKPGPDPGRTKEKAPRGAFSWVKLSKEA